MDVKWVVDSTILESRVCLGNIPQAIRNNGLEVFVTEYQVGKEPDFGPWTEKDCVVLYGSHNFIRRNKTAFLPGAYGLTESTSCSHYYSHLPKEWMLNSGFTFLPYSSIRNDTERVFDLFDGQFFVRPNSGFKTFAGQVLNRENYLHELNSLDQLSSVMPETFCLVAPVQELKGEFRFVIAANEVVDGSCYRWDDRLDVRHDWDNDCLRLAKEVSRHDWQPDLVYTCDVALTADGPKVVELNSFCCAGLYATDKERVFGRVSEVAKLDFQGFFDG